MAKKHRRPELPGQIPAYKPGGAGQPNGGQPIISRPGKKMIACGIGILASGFFVLTYTDPYGRNWASTLAPFLILGGYGIVAAGIFMPDSARHSANHQDSVETSATRP